MNKGECVAALQRLRTINLDIVLDELGYEKAESVSFYGMNDYPTLEMSGDLDLFEELINLYFKDRPEDSGGIVDSVDIEMGDEYDELLE